MTTKVKEPVPEPMRVPEADTGSLDRLLAEIWGLAMLLPGHPPPVRSDAEIEAEFDNMPV